jgi:hypothetical protein
MFNIATVSHAIQRYGTVATTVVTLSLASGCAAPISTEATGLSTDMSENAVDADDHVASTSTALIVPPAGSGGFAYVADYTVSNAGLCIQPGKKDYFGIDPILGDCANAGARLSLYSTPAGGFYLCLRDSLHKGSYEDPYGEEYYAYVGTCLFRTDKNSLRFVDGVVLSVKWDDTGYTAAVGSWWDIGGGRFGYTGSARVLTNVKSHAKLQSKGGGADQVWTVTRF